MIYFPHFFRGRSESSHAFLFQQGQPTRFSRGTEVLDRIQVGPVENGELAEQVGHDLDSLVRHLALVLHSLNRRIMLFQPLH